MIIAASGILSTVAQTQATTKETFLLSTTSPGPGKKNISFEI